MKKIIRILVTLSILVLFVGCSSLSSSVKKVKNVFTTQTDYNNVIATFVTTQGDISFYLYPEAAPVTVANFINLAKRGFYDNTKFFRMVDNFAIQGGDPTESGYGGTGYNIIEERADWLDFYQPGMLAMANAGPNTGSSQFFMTFYPADWLNGLHTIFGEVKSDSDYNRLKKLEVGDVVKEIKFEGDADLILSLNKELVDQWNEVLDKNFPYLKKYPVKAATPEQVAAYKAEMERIYSKQKEKKEDTFEYPTTKLIRGIFNRLGKFKPRDPIVTEEN